MKKEQNNKEQWVLAWSEKFYSGNEKIDDYHRTIIEGMDTLYKMCADAKKYADEIPELTNKLETAMRDHMDLEIYYLEKFDIPTYKVHSLSHDKYKSELNLYREYIMNPVIRAILISETAREYMKKHFFQFDVYDIPKINEKLRESKE